MCPIRWPRGGPGIRRFSSPHRIVRGRPGGGPPMKHWTKSSAPRSPGARLIRRDMADRRSYTEISCRGQPFQRPDPAVNPLVTWLLPSLCVLSLIWPALWNGYPIVFSDSGTYLSQAMHRYLGWDRPMFYSLFIFPLHLGLTTWPVILVQSCLMVLVLDLTRRAFGVSRWWLLALTVFLAVTTPLPWVVSELMPDLFTPSLVLLLSLLVFSRSYFRPWQRIAMTALAAFMIATQQSSVPLAIALLGIVIPLRWIARRLRTGPRG